MTRHHPSSLTSVAKVTGSENVPVPPATPLRPGQGWAMPGPGGELSAQPYRVMKACTLVWAGAAVGEPNTLSATIRTDRTTRVCGDRRRCALVTGRAYRTESCLARERR